MSDVAKIDQSDPRAHTAVVDFRDTYGIDITQVLSPDMWSVLDLDGTPELALTQRGVRV